jgi:hypothetical protein
MPRELTNLEIEAFLTRHAEIANAVQRIRDGGYTAVPLAYPNAGVAVREPSSRYVLVWRDASLHWHFIDLSDMTAMETIAAQVNLPEYISDPGSLELIHSELGNLGNAIVSVLRSLSVVLVIGLVAYLVFAFVPALRRV